MAWVAPRLALEKASPASRLASIIRPRKVDVVRIVQGRQKIRGDQADRLEGVEVGDRRVGGGDEGLDGVAQGIHAGARRQIRAAWSSW